MKKTIYLIFIIPMLNFAQVQFKSAEFEIGIRKHLNLSQTELINLNSIDTIKKIDLSGLNIRDVNDVIYLKKIKILNLANNQIIDISPLLSLPRLNVLNIAGNNIENISSFTFSDKRSFKLIVSDNQISDFQNLQTATFSNVVVIGNDRQQVESPNFLLNNLYTLTQSNGQAIIKYNIWDNLNDCLQFTINYGDGNSNNSLQCDSYTKTQNYSYSNSGFKTINITRENKVLTTHFVAPYNFTFDISQNYPINLSLPGEINLVSLENTTNLGTATILNNEVNYQPTTIGNDIIKVKYRYGTSNRIEMFYIFTTNTNTLSVEDFENTKSFTLFPNPFVEELQIASKEQSITQVQLYDLTGKLIQEEKVDNQNTFTLKTNGLPIGAYLITIYTDKGKESYKVIKK